MILNPRLPNQLVEFLKLNSSIGNGGLSWQNVNRGYLAPHSRQKKVDESASDSVWLPAARHDAANKRL